eukprot:jgi/Mesvir1/21165/Mv08926-RA.1
MAPLRVITTAQLSPADSEEATAHHCTVCTSVMLKVMVSELAEKDMHTYLGMLGYCNKDAHKPAADFRVIIDVGNTPAMMEDGRIIFMKYHATSKGKVALSPSNILQKMHGGVHECEPDVGGH